MAVFPSLCIIKAGSTFENPCTRLHLNTQQLVVKKGIAAAFCNLSPQSLPEFGCVLCSGAVPVRIAGVHYAAAAACGAIVPPPMGATV